MGRRRKAQRTKENGKRCSTPVEIEDDDTFLARCLMEQYDYRAALQYYDEAVSQYPTNVALISEERQSCLHLLKQSTSLPISTFPSAQQSEFEISYAKRTALLRCKPEHGRKYTINPMQNEDLHNEQEILMKAYSSYYGWGTAKDFAKAVEYFKQAMLGRTTKAEAYFRIAEMQLNGLGTNQNIPEAIQKFQEIALLPHINPVDIVNNQRNVGVGESCHILGRYYEEEAQKEEFGSCDLTFEIASMWYEIGNQSQHGLSSHSQALMRMTAKGGPPNDSVIEACWKAAINNKYYNAYFSLAQLYIQQMEYDKAKSVIESGLKIQRGTISDLLAKPINQLGLISKDITQRNEMEVELFEELYDLTKDGLHFQQRLIRMENVSMYTTEMEELKKELSGGQEIYVSTNNDVKQNGPHFTLMENTHFDNLCWRNAINYQPLRRKHYSSELLQTVLNYCQVIKIVNLNAKDRSNLKDYKNAAKFVFLLRDLLKLDPFAIKWESHHLSIAYTMLQEILSADFHQQNRGSTFALPFSKALSICLAEIGAKQDLSELGIKFLVRAWTMFPEEVQLSITLAEYYADKQEFDRAYIVGAEALERFPGHVNMLFNHAQICLRTTNGIIASSQDMKHTAIQYLTKFLKFAPVDHPRVPEAYYTLGKLHYDIYKDLGETGIKLSVKVAKHFVKLGEDAEQNQLTCFTPYRSHMKDTLLSLQSEHEPTPMLTENSANGNNSNYICREVKVELDQDNRNSIVMNSINSKPTQNFGEDTKRIGLIVNLRSALKHQLDIHEGKQSPVHYTPLYEGHDKLFKLWPITVHEALSCDNKMWENRVLALTVIDEAISGFGLEAIHLIAEDDKRDAVHVMLCLFSQDLCVQRKFGFGCKLQILQPHCQVVDGEKVVTTNDASNVICHGRDVSLCRYCLQPGAKTSCSRCKWANYCNKQCQSMDWKILKHKKICHLYPSWNMDLRGPSEN